MTDDHNRPDAEIKTPIHKRIWHWVVRFLKTRRGRWITAFLILGTWYAFCLPSRLFKEPTSTVLLDKDGVLLGARIAKDGQWRFPERKTVPAKFAACIVQFEDRSFYKHPGVNPFALGRAIKQNISDKRIVSGGSTLTMQVIRISRKNPPRTFWQKGIELILATRLECSYSKEEILALYASHAPFGSNVVGIDAASWRYFGRSPEQLSWAESATLAVLPNAPSLIFPGKNQERLKAKRNRLLDRLQEAKIIDEITCQLAKDEPLPGAPHALPRFAPHLIDRVSKEGHDGEIVQTTLDLNLQQRVSVVIEKHHRSLMANDIHNAAALVLDVNTGNVLAYVGNTEERKIAADQMQNEYGNAVDVIPAPRSTGSILKPFLYASMLHDGEILPNTLIADIPTDMSGYQPENFSHTYDGAVPARRALARSLNIPAVRMLQSYHTDRFHGQLKKMGMTTLTQGPDHYGLSLILGGAEGSVWDIAGMYASMARTLNRYNRTNGYDKTDFHAPRYMREQAVKDSLSPDKNSFLDAASIWFTFEAMVEVARPDEEAGWMQYSSSNRVAWKTGTSFGFRDGWAIGVTPNYVVAVWVGNANGEGRPGLTGIATAAPILFDVFTMLRSPVWFKRPDKELENVYVCKASGHRALDICEKQLQPIPKAGLKTAPCPYHRLIHLDATGQHRVTSECEAVDQMRHEAWFVLPPAMEFYYKTKNPQYSMLPPLREGCGGAIVSSSMEFMYPRNATQIYIPIELDGRPGRTVFEIAHRKSTATIYWHLDDQYLGSTSDIHHMALNPEPGKHTVTAVDESGETISVEVEIVSEKRK